MSFWQSRGLIILALAGSLALVMVVNALQQIVVRVDMAHTHFAYAQAYHLSRQHLAAHSMGSASNVPESSGAWVNTFKNEMGKPLIFAPAGGPGFVLNKQGSALTGAIGVTATNFGRDLILVRPAYRHLDQQAVTVRQMEVLSQVQGSHQASP